MAERQEDIGSIRARFSEVHPLDQGSQSNIKPGFEFSGVIYEVDEIGDVVCPDPPTHGTEIIH